MKDTEAAQIIKSALQDNGRQWAAMNSPYSTFCHIDDLTEQIVNRLRARGAFEERSIDDQRTT